MSTLSRQDVAVLKSGVGHKKNQRRRKEAKQGGKEEEKEQKEKEKEKGGKTLLLAMMKTPDRETQEGERKGANSRKGKRKQKTKYRPKKNDPKPVDARSCFSSDTVTSR